MERRKFTREFKLEAVKLIKERGVSYVQAAQDLGVHQSVLRTSVSANCRHRPGRDRGAVTARVCGPHRR
jgi:transposase-like protein